MFLWYVFGVFLCLVAACEYSTFKTRVPTVTSVPAVRKKMIEILCAEKARKKGENKPFLVLDLGSGTGKLALEIAQALPDAIVTGLEISPVPFALSLVRKYVWRVKNVTYLREDFWAYDVSNVAVAVLYINGAIRERMAKKLAKELQPGALVIMNETQLPGWTPLEEHKVGLLKVKVVVYRIGAHDDKPVAQANGSGL